MITLLLIAVVIAIYLVPVIKVASEDERFAVTLLGRYQGLRGPGLALNVAAPVAVWTRLQIGQRGELNSNGFASFGARSVPVRLDGLLEPGGFVQITNFETSGPEARVVVVPHGDQRRMLLCEKCGHEMPLT